jgi:hypothetical protein
VIISKATTLPSEQRRNESLKFREKENVAPVSIDEIKALYKEAKNKHDRAILSTLLSGGCGVAEWIQFANEWFRYVDDKRQAKRPFESTSPGPR